MHQVCTYSGFENFTALIERQVNADSLVSDWVRVFGSKLLCTLATQQT